MQNHPKQQQIPILSPEKHKQESQKGKYTCVHITMCAHTPKQMINHAAEPLLAKWIKGQGRGTGLCQSICASVCLTVDSTVYR